MHAFIIIHSKAAAGDLAKELYKILGSKDMCRHAWVPEPELQRAVDRVPMYMYMHRSAWRFILNYKLLGGKMMYRT